MKNKLLLAGVLVLAMAVVFKVGTVLGEGTILRICKTNGGILMARENCPGGSIEYDLVTGGSGRSSVMGNGTLSFIGESKVLKNNGTVWYFFESYEGNSPVLEWREDFSMRLVKIDVKTILQWNEKYFITTDGNAYRFGPNGWELTIQP